MQQERAYYRHEPYQDPIPFSADMVGITMGVVTALLLATGLALLLSQAAMASSAVARNPTSTASYWNGGIRN